MKTSRRGFLTGLGAVVALPAAAVEAVGKAIFSEPVSGRKIYHAYSEFGWIDTPKSSWTKIITTTLKNKRHMLMDNVSRHNPLYHKLLRQDIKKAIYELTTKPKTEIYNAGER